MKAIIVLVVPAEELTIGDKLIGPDMEHLAVAAIFNTGHERVQVTFAEGEITGEFWLDAKQLVAVLRLVQ